MSKHRLPNYFDPAEVTLEQVILYTMGTDKDIRFGDNWKMEDHPHPNKRFPGMAGWIEINISNPDSPKGHDSYDIPYDEDGVFGKAVPHNNN